MHPLRPARLCGLLLALLVAALAGCATSLPNRNPVGEVFPEVRGTGLDGRPWTLPDDLRGGPALLLVGYEMETQFDIDRWLLGLFQAGTPVRLLEVPTIPGLVAGAFAGRIDSGMRSGIPAPDWAGVVTVYRGDAERITRLTGTERDRNTRVLLLDADGKVVWFHDAGYSPRVLLELDRRVRALPGGG